MSAGIVEAMTWLNQRPGRSRESFARASVHVYTKTRPPGR